MTVTHIPQVLQAMEASMMQLDDEAFVRQAYLRLLGRSADPEGFAGYLGQLRQGAARADIYHELSTSDEVSAMKRAAGLPHLGGVHACLSGGS